MLTASSSELRCESSQDLDNAIVDAASHVSSFTLDNGMTFVIMERRRAPIVSFLTRANVGSMYDPPECKGLAHLVEHLAFSGSSAIGTLDYEKERVALEAVDESFCALREAESRGAATEYLEEKFQSARQDADKLAVKSELSNAIEDVGGRGLCATTSVDSTDFSVVLPSNAVEMWFYLESERFLDPVFRGFYNEQQIVMDEIQLHESNPLNKLGAVFRATAFSIHPYRFPSAGYVEDVRNISRSVAESFFKLYFTPASLTSVIIGDIDSKDILELATSYFGRIPRGRGIADSDLVEPEQVRQREARLRFPNKNMILMGYHIPSIAHPDYLVFEILSSLLSEGCTPRLNRALVSNKQVAIKAQGIAGVPGKKCPNLFVFVVYVAPGHTCDFAKRALEEEIELLKAQSVNAHELETAKRLMFARIIRTLNENSSIADRLAIYQTSVGDWQQSFKQLAALRRISIEDIQRCVTSAFRPGNRTIAMIETA